jgi:CNT family concentrative nucleoside transporter
MSSHMQLIIQATVGILIFTGFLWVIGRGKGSLPRTLIAIAIHSIFVFIVLKIDYIAKLFDYITQAIMALSDATIKGTSFVFGYLGGGPAPFEITSPKNLFIFTFQLLPITIVLGAFSALFSYLGVTKSIVRYLGKVTKKTIKISGSMGFCAIANIFLGQTDVTLSAKNHVKFFGRAELLILITIGMATTSAAMLPLYARIMSGDLEQTINTLLVSTIINIILSVILCKLVLPHTGNLQHTDADDSSAIDDESAPRNAFEAIAHGTADGTQICVATVATLIVSIAFISVIDNFLSTWGVTFSNLLGYVMAPVMWLIGIPAEEIAIAGSIMGIKTAANEVIGFSLLATNKDLISPSSVNIITYAICSYSNFSSIGIQIAGIGAIVGSKGKSEVASLAPLALLISTLVGCINAAIIGIINNLSAF